MDSTTMSLMRPQRVLLLIVFLIFVEVNSDIQGPAAGVLSEFSKDNDQKKESHQPGRDDSAHQQSQQQLSKQQQELQQQVLNQQDKSPVVNEVHRQAANIKDDFRVTSADIQQPKQQHLPSQQHQQSSPQQQHQEPHSEHHQLPQQEHEHQPEQEDALDAHHGDSQLPLGQTDQGKGKISPDNGQEKAPADSEPPSQADAVSEVPSHDAQALSENNVVAEDVDLEAPPPEHIPLSKSPVNEDMQQQKPQDQKQQLQPLPEATSVDKVLQDQSSQAAGESSVDGKLEGSSTDAKQEESSADTKEKESTSDAKQDKRFPDVGTDPLDGENTEAKRILTEEEIEGERLFQAGEKLINATYYKEYKEAYLNFLQASQLNHTKAKEYVAFGHLLGDYLPQNITRATELFNELASMGSPKAQMGLAFMYSAGFHYNSSQAKALIYLTFGALGGDPLAQMALGYRYYAGIGVESKCETALTYYRKVATKVAESVTLAGGPVVQRIRLQEETESQGTNNSPLLDDDLLQYYHFLADKGDSQAQIVLGTLYYQGGKGVQINHEQAYHYFSTAAESGNGHALGYLGKMHSEGSPVVTQNNHTALEYFRKSAEKNNHIGQTGLGMMYLNGLGVEKDTSKAFRYFSLASDQGSVDAQLQLGIMYFTGNGVRKDYKMAVKYFTMSSQNGHVLAFFNLAQMHATGTGVLRNCHTAVELFKNVAERGRWSEMLMDAHRMYHEGNIDAALVKYMFLAELGYEVAQSNVAYILDSGLSSKFTRYETHQRALLQYSRAASQGSTHARLKMGDYHYYGLGTDVDYELAAYHYGQASDQQHNAQAMFNLGYMHEKGLGLKQDVHLAKRFYDRAAETSLDAHVPVGLALFKLGLFYGIDIFNKEFEGPLGIITFLNPATYLGPMWDLYLAAIMAIICGTLYFLRRFR